MKWYIIHNAGRQIRCDHESFDTKEQALHKLKTSYNIQDDAYVVQSPQCPQFVRYVP